MPETAFTIRQVADADRVPLAKLFAAVADERDGIASEPPIDIESRAASWRLDAFFLAVAGDQGDRLDQRRGQPTWLRRDRHCGSTGLAWRGVGSALMETAIE
jgi:hypothetical protein